MNSFRNNLSINSNLLLKYAIFIVLINTAIGLFLVIYFFKITSLLPNYHLVLFGSIYFILNGILIRNFVKNFNWENSDHSILSYLLTSLSDEIFIEDMNFNIIYSNKSDPIFNAVKNSKFKMEELISISDLFSESSKMFIEDILRKRESRSEEIILETNDNQYFLLNYNPIELEGLDRKDLVYVWMFKNVTEKKIEQDHMEEEKLRMINANRLSQLGEMSASVAHEINNPLTVVVGGLASLRKKINSGEDLGTEKYINSLLKIEKNAERISKIISSLKVLSRDGSGDKLVQEYISEVVKNTIDFFTEKLKEKNIQIYFGSSFEGTIPIREVEISQVIYNLMSNSIDAVMSLDNPWIKVSILLNDSNLQIDFIDSGNGIPDELVDKIMNPFFTTKPLGHGTGLGLSISQKIIKKHHGKFFIDKKSINTKFVILLPLKCTDDMEIYSFDEAIDAHIEFRNKIVHLFNNFDSSIDIERLQNDQCCSLGQWIYNNTDKYKEIGEFNSLRNTHHDFHQFVGECLTEQKIDSFKFSKLVTRYHDDLRRITIAVIDKIKKFGEFIDKEDL